MNNIRNQLLLLTAFTFISLPCVADPFPGLQNVMDQAEINKTGINKLSREELDALNKWLSQYMNGNTNNAKTGSAAASEANFGLDRKREKKPQPKLIVSQIEGNFNGWSDNTIFRLKNGQVWQQRYKSTLHYRAVNPKVEIKKSLFGFYMLHIIGTSFEVGVRRIK